MYACTGASPSAFAICGLPPERSFTGLAPFAVGLALGPVARQVLCDRALDQGLQRLRIEHLPLPDVDGATRVSLEAGVEESLWVIQDAPRAKVSLTTCL